VTTSTQIQLLLKSIDTLMVSRGLPGLNDVQMTVLASALAGESYPEIADRSTYTVEYIREVGSKLWHILSQALGELVTKKNIRSVLARYQQSLAAVELERQYFWGEAIDVSTFYGRTTELKTLGKWITKDRCRLIEILAMGGMGKTALAVKLAQQLPTEFDFVVWRSLRNAPPLSDILVDTIALLSRQQEITLSIDPQIHLARLIHYLQEQRCLLIFDNVESILQGGSSRQYLAGYEGYGELFRQVAECSHQSCVLLTSREQIAEVANFAGDSLPVRTLPLGGLSIEAGMSILDDKGLPLTIDKGEQLIDLYAGNPLALKIISTSILEVFDGQITEFFEQGTAVFNGIRMLLERQFERLSPLEKQVMFWLAINREWVSIGELQADLFPTVSTAQLLEALEYLQGRSLIEVKRGKFTQQPVVMEYAIEKLLGLIRAEIGSQTPQLFLSFALMKAQSKDYVRDSQIRVIVRPLLVMLASDLGGEGSIVKALQHVLARFEVGSFAAGSYGAGNCLNLLNQFAADLTGLDLRGLSIRQADLREVPLPQVNLTQANLATSLFAESIGDVLKVAISPDDRLVAKGGSNGKIIIWELGTGQNVHSIKAHDSHVVGLVFTANSKKLISSSFDQTIKIWDLESGSCLQILQLQAPVYRIAINQDSTILASGSNCGDILLWDIVTGKILKRLVGHKLTVVDLSFQPEGNLLASSSFDTSIKIWNLDTEDCVNTLIGHTHLVFSVNFNFQGTQVVSSGLDKSIKIWDVDSGQCLQTIQKHNKTVIDVMFSPNGQQIISGSQDLTVRIWDEVTLHNWECTKILQGHENTIWSITINTTGKILISSDQGGVLKIWDVQLGQCIKTFGSTSKVFRSLAFHPQKNLLASSSEDRQIQLWDVSTHKCLSTIVAHKIAVWQVAFSPNGDVLASCGMDGVVKLWNITDNSTLQRYTRLTQEILRPVFAIAFHPDGKILATGSVDSVCLWDYRSGKLLKKLDRSGLGQVAFHPTGQQLAAADHDPNINIWDLEAGAEREASCWPNRSFQGHKSENWTVAFHPHGYLLASGGEDQDIRVWHIDTGECCYVLSEHTAPITSVAFSPDGNYLASSSKDRTIRIWEVATGKCIRTLTSHTDLVNFVVFHPDTERQLLASCSHDETIRLWDMDFWLCTKTLRLRRIYEEMNITGAIGLAPAQLVMLKTLGAITN
jgi:WD40 repeat protein